MKVRFDEQISRRIAAALRAFLSGRPGLQIDHVGDHHPPGTDDPTWISQFAAEGGNAVVSGDAQILQHWPNLIAYMESGLIAIFPPPDWDRAKGFVQASLVIIWWPCIVERIKMSSPGDCWRLPWNWNPSVNGLKQLKDPRLAKGQMRLESGIKPLPAKHQFRPGDDE